MLAAGARKATHSVGACTRWQEFHAGLRDYKLRPFQEIIGAKEQSSIRRRAAPLAQPQHVWPPRHLPIFPPSVGRAVGPVSRLSLLLIVGLITLTRRLLTSPTPLPPPPPPRARSRLACHSLPVIIWLRLRSMHVRFEKRR